ncbi:hypothetical protein [Enterobacter hormaechei]|uniref:hypothetical protein n=1 Tax=Enterobacter hormaechei TaxID=158836 RepID=UPI0020863D0C|nr:hypothetical protein FJMB00501_45840 [Enterobacter hormaechei]
MRPSVVLDMKRSAVREAVGRFRAANPRVFGSVLHGALLQIVGGDKLIIPFC